MAGKRASGPRPSTSRAAKQILKSRKRKAKHGIPETKPEVSKKGLWIFVVAALVIVGFVVARIVAIVR